MLRALLKRQIVVGFRGGIRNGALRSVRLIVSGYGLADAVPCSDPRTAELTKVPTLPCANLERLISRGYANCDAGMRRCITSMPPKPKAFPYRGRL